MPETTYMEVDPRRDHSLRVPRPDLSVELQTPNACTRCHLDEQRIGEEKRPKLKQYADWLSAARDGDEEIKAELARVDPVTAARLAPDNREVVALLQQVIRQARSQTTP